jgi:hypothetical protein
MSLPVFVNTVGALGLPAVRLAASSIYRPLPPQTSGWTKLRITALVQFNSNYTQLVSGSPRLFIGLSSGTAYGYNDRGTTHVVGGSIVHTPVSGGAYPYTNAAIDYYLTYMFAMMKVGDTLTAGGGTYQGSIVFQEAVTDNYSLFLMEIAKGAPNWSISSRHRTGLTNIENTYFDMYTTQFFAGGNVAEFPDDNASFQTGNGTLAVDEGTNGTLDHLHVSFSHQFSTMDLVGIAVRKFA